MSLGPLSLGALHHVLRSAGRVLTRLSLIRIAELRCDYGPLREGP